MTVQNTANFVDYVGDDATTVFNFTFRVDDISWLSVDFIDDFDQFNINLDQDASPGGNATYLVAPPSPGMGGPDPSFRITRTTPQSQLLAYTRYDPFDSLSHESALDRLTMQVQDTGTTLSVGDANLQLQIDTNLLLITTGLSPGHQHVVADIIDFGAHTDPTADENITGQWDFINNNGIRVFSAGFVDGGQFRVATSYLEVLALGAVVGFRSNGSLQVTELGVVVNSLTFSHDGVDGQIVGANMGDINISGITGRLTQGAEDYAYLSDIAAAGLLPLPVAGQMLVSDGATWFGSTNLAWDDTAREMTFSSSVAGQVLIRMVPTQSTDYVALRMEDQSGNFFQFVHDFALSTINQEFILQSSGFGDIWEIENEGNLWFGGSESFCGLAVVMSVGNGQVRIGHGTGATLYLTPTAAEQSDFNPFGQIWVDSADQSLHYKGFGIADINLSAGGGGGGSGASGSITYAFDSTLNGDPGAGNFRMSTANPANIAALTFSDTDANALDIQNILGTMTAGCHIIMRNIADNSQYRLYVVQSIVDNVGWWQFNLDQQNGNGDATIGAVGTEIEFEFFTTGWLEPGISLGGNNDELAYWNPSVTHWEGSGTLINVNVASPPLGGRLFLGTTSGVSTASPQIMRGLGAADTIMDYVFGTDANNGFFQRYARSTAPDEMGFGARIASVNTDLLMFDLNANILVEAAAIFRIGEKAAAGADLTAYGQIWVDSADDSLNYTTEAGVNFDLTAGAAAGNVRGAKVFHSITQSIPNSTVTTVTYNSEAYDTDAVHSGGSPTRLTVPTGVTRIRLTAYVKFAPNGSSFRVLSIRKNGAGGTIDDDQAGFEPDIYASAANATVPELGMFIDTGIIRAVATDFFEVRVEQLSGLAINLQAGDVWFQMEIIE
jgi:hypothetical protein